MRSARNGERTASEEGRAPRRLRLLAVALAFGLIAAACGGDDEDAVDSTAGDTGSSAGSSEPAEPAADDPDAADESGTAADADDDSADDSSSSGDASTTETPDPGDTMPGGTLRFANWQWLEEGRGVNIWDAVAAYEQVNPNVTLEQQAIVRDDFESTLQTEFGAGGGPDLFVIPDTFFAELVNAGLLASLDEVAAECGADMNANNDALVRNGSQQAFSWEVVNYAMFWNQNILDEAGVTPPSNVDELIEAALQIEANTDAEGFAVRHLITGEVPWWFDINNWFQGHGGGWSSNGQLTIDSAENIAALTAYERVVNSGAFPVGDDASTFRQKFREGRLGMMIDNSSAVLTLVGEAVASTDVGSSRLPFPTDGASNVPVHVGVNANSDNLEAALDWACWFISDGQAGLAVALAPSAVATNAPAADSFIAENPWVPVFQAQSGTSPVVVGFEAETPIIRNIVLTAVERVLLEGADPAEALARAQAEAQDEVG